MRRAFDILLGGMLSAALVGAAGAQPVRPTPVPASAPASVPASAPEPETAASRAIPTRNVAITAAENAKEPGVQRPDERVIPQISVPLVRKNSPVSATATASAPSGSIPGAVNDGVARCLAVPAQEKAACERAAAAAVPVKR